MNTYNPAELNRQVVKFLTLGWVVLNPNGMVIQGSKYFFEFLGSKKREESYRGAHIQKAIPSLANIGEVIKSGNLPEREEIIVVNFKHDTGDGERMYNVIVDPVNKGEDYLLTFFEEEGNGHGFSVIVQKMYLAHQRLEEEARKIVEANEILQEKIARDIHDDLGQMLTALKMKTMLVLTNFDDQKSRGEARTVIGGEIDKIAERTRNLSRRLGSDVIVSFGLVEAIENLVNTLKNYIEDISFDFRFQNMRRGHRFDRDVEITLYRIAQESLNNACKHSNASEVLVTLTRLANSLVLSVVDNGRGFNVEEMKLFTNSLGLANMRTRARLMHGQLLITSDEKGTMMSVEIPTQEKLA